MDPAQIAVGTTPKECLPSTKRNAWQFLLHLHEVCNFQTKEGKKVGRASNSELKRWIQNNVLQINGESVKWDEPMDFPIFSVVLFPKSARITLL